MVLPSGQFQDRRSCGSGGSDLACGRATVARLALVYADLSRMRSSSSGTALFPSVCAGVPCACSFSGPVLLRLFGSRTSCTVPLELRKGLACVCWTVKNGGLFFRTHIKAGIILPSRGCGYLRAHEDKMLMGFIRKTALSK